MGSVRKVRDGVWDGRIRTPDGGSRQKRFTRERDAETWVTMMEASKIGGAFTDPKPNMTLRQWYATWVAEEEQALDPRAPATMKTYADYWRCYFANDPIAGMPLNAITPADCNAFRARVAQRSMEPKRAADRRKDKPSPHVLRGAQRLLHLLLNEAVFRDPQLIVRNPATMAKGRKSKGKLPSLPTPQIEPLTPAEINAVAQAMPEQYQAFVYLMAYTSLRWSEMVGLTIDRIDRERRRLVIPDTDDAKIVDVGGHLLRGRPKTDGSARVVTIPRVAWVPLVEYLLKYSPGVGGLVFHDRNGNPVRGSTFRRIWKRALAEAGIERVKPGHLRHTGASLAAVGETDLGALSERLGHRYLSTTQKYLRRFDAQDQAIADKLDRMAADPEATQRQLRG